MSRPKTSWILRLAAAAILIPAGLALAAVLALRADPVSTGLVRVLSGRFAPDGTSLEAEQVPRLGLRGATLVGLDFQDRDRGIRVRVDTLHVAYRAWAARIRRIPIDRVEVAGLEIEVETPGEGTLDRRGTEGTGPPPEPEAPGAPWEILVGEVTLRPGGPPPASLGAPAPEDVESTFRVASVAGRVQGLRVSRGVGAEAWTLDATFAPAGRSAGWGALTARGELSPGGVRVDTLFLRSPRSRVAGRLRLPFDSTLARPGGLEWRLEAMPLALADLDGLVPVPAVMAGDSLVLASWSEPVGDSASVRLDARTSAGAVVEAEAVWGRSGSRVGYRIQGRMAAVELRRYLGERLPVGPASGSVTSQGEAEWADGGITALRASADAQIAAPEGEAELAAGLVRNAAPDGPPRDSVDLRIRRLRWGDELEVDGELQALRSGDRVDWRADLSPRSGGRLRGSGRLSGLGALDEPVWQAELRLDSLSEPRSASRISGRVQGEGAGVALPTALTADLASTRVAGWPLDTAVIRWTGRREDGRVEATLTGPSGRVGLDAALAVGDTGGRVRLLRLELDSVAAPPRDPAGPLDSLRVTGRATGELRWEGPLSGLGDRGLWSGEMEAVVLGVDGLSDVPPVDSLMGTVRLQRGAVDGRLRAEMAGDGRVALRVRGTVASPLALEVSEGRFTDLDVATILPSAPATRLTGTLAGRIDRTPGSGGPSVRGRIDLGSSTVRGGEIRSVAAEVVSTPDTLRAEIVGELAGGTVHTEFQAPGGWGRGGWTLEADAVLPQLGAFLGQPDTAVSLSGHLAAQGDPGAGAVLALDLQEATGWGARLDTAVVRGTLSGTMLSVDTVLVRSNVASADGGGLLPTAVLGLPGVDSLLPAGPGVAGTSALTLSLSVPDSAAVLRISSTGRVEVGAGRIDLRSSCRGERCDLNGDVELSTVLLGRWSLRSLRGGVEGSVGPGRRFGETRSGLLAEEIRTPRLDASSASVQLGWDGEALDVRVASVVDRRRAGVAELQVDPDARSLAVQRLDLRFDEDRWTLERPFLFQEDSTGISLDSLVLTSDRQRILARVGRVEGLRFLSLRVDSLRLAAFTDLLERPELGGIASGVLRTGGSGESFRLQAELNADITFEGRPYHRIEGSAEARLGEFAAELAVRDPSGLARITGQGSGTLLPDSSRAWRWTAQLEADDVPLGWTTAYAPPELARNATGTLYADLTLERGSDGPSARGPLELRDGRVELPLADIVLRDLQVASVLEGRTLRLDSARATSRGRLNLDGSVTLPPEGPLEMDLRALADDFLASNSRTLEAAFSGEIDVGGTLEVPRIEGGVEVLQASYRMPGTRGARRVRQVTLTEEDWATLQSRFGISRPERQEPNRWLPRTAILDVGVKLGRDIWLRRDANPELALQFTGEMDVTKASEDQALELQGTIDVIPQRSYVEEFGRRFTLEEGRVELRGPVDDTRLDVTGAYRVRTRADEDPVTIRLNVTGWVDQLTLDLSSEPDLSNGDIVSYLATGRPLSSAFATGGGGSGLGADFLASQVSGTLEQFAQEEVGLDILQIEQEGLHGTSLVAGKYVNPRLFLGFRQGVTYQADEGRSFSDGLTSQAEVEYSALDWLVVNIQGGTSAIRFFLEGTYGW